MSINPSLAQFNLFPTNGIFKQIISFVHINIIFILLFSFQLSAAENIIIDSWHLTTDDGIAQKVSPKASGLFTDTRGVIIYTADVYIPSNFNSTVLCFYCDLIDDSDIAYFNGHKIGATGKVPNSDTAVDKHNFRSASRLPRIYTIPGSVINYDEKNQLKIKVFNYSGTGGILYNSDLEIGDFNKLEKRYFKRLLRNDVPRVFTLGILLFLLLLQCNSFRTVSPFRFASIFRYTVSSLFPWWRVNSEVENRIIVQFKLLANIYIIFAIMVTIFSELSFKYLLYDNELFWFKVPAFFYFSGFVVFLTEAYTELFTQLNTLLNRSDELLLRFASAFYHPVLFLPVLFYILIAEPWQSWGALVSNFLYWMIGSIVIVIIISLVVIIKIFKNEKESAIPVQEKIIEIAIRFGVLFFILTAIIGFIYQIHIIFDYVTLILGVPFIIYATTVTSFYRKYNYEISIGKMKKNQSL
jgi:hypothetical protein